MEIIKTIKTEGEIHITEGDLRFVELIAKSYTAKEIAEELGKNHRTIEAQIVSLRKKYSVAGNVGLVLLFCREGLI